MRKLFLSAILSVLCFGNVGCIDPAIVEGFLAFSQNAENAAYDINPNLAAKYEANGWSRPDDVRPRRAQFYENHVAHHAYHETCDQGYDFFCDHDHPNIFLKAEHFVWTNEWPNQ